jgi:hypothetical protein
MIIKYLRKFDKVQIFGAGMDLSGSEWDSAVGSCERSNGPSDVGAIQKGEFRNNESTIFSKTWCGSISSILKDKLKEKSDIYNTVLNLLKKFLIPTQYTTVVY